MFKPYVARTIIKQTSPEFSLGRWARKLLLAQTIQDKQTLIERTLTDLIARDRKNTSLVIESVPVSYMNTNTLNLALQTLLVHQQSDLMWNVYNGVVQDGRLKELNVATYTALLRYLFAIGDISSVNQVAETIVQREDLRHLQSISEVLLAGFSRLDMYNECETIFKKIENPSDLISKQMADAKSREIIRSFRARNVQVLTNEDMQLFFELLRTECRASQEYIIKCVVDILAVLPSSETNLSTVFTLVENYILKLQAESSIESIYLIYQLITKWQLKRENLESLLQMTYTRNYQQWPMIATIFFEQNRFDYFRWMLDYMMTSVLRWNIAPLPREVLRSALLTLLEQSNLDLAHAYLEEFTERYRFVADTALLNAFLETFLSQQKQRISGGGLEGVDYYISVFLTQKYQFIPDKQTHETVLNYYVAQSDHRPIITYLNRYKVQSLEEIMSPLLSKITDQHVLSNIHMRMASVQEPENTYRIWQKTLKPTVDPNDVK